MDFFHGTESQELLTSLSYGLIKSNPYYKKTFLAKENAIALETKSKMTNNFKIGDLVTVSKIQFWPTAKGWVGKVLAITKDDLFIAIEFNHKHRQLHSCEGRGKENSCYWVVQSFVSRLLPRNLNNPHQSKCLNIRTKLQQKDSQ